MDNELGTEFLFEGRSFHLVILPSRSRGHLQDEELDLFRSYLPAPALPLLFRRLTSDSEITEGGLSSS